MGVLTYLLTSSMLLVSFLSSLELFRVFLIAFLVKFLFRMIITKCITSVERLVVPQRNRIIQTGRAWQRTLHLPNSICPFAADDPGMSTRRFRTIAYTLGSILVCLGLIMLYCLCRSDLLLGNICYQIANAATAFVIYSRRPTPGTVQLEKDAVEFVWSDDFFKSPPYLWLEYVSKGGRYLWMKLFERESVRRAYTLMRQ
ncbi:hypothetical protein GGR57DRAFT_510608 [Xylariaceae sp. FL1272]|nr:hypothetical protein GGR57DRAFT_510608 [Xylariaceae sp. FL1272]